MFYATFVKARRCYAGAKTGDLDMSVADGLITASTVSVDQRQQQ